MADKKPAKIKGIMKLVDDAYELSLEIKSRQAKLDNIKAKVKQHGHATDQEIIEGNKAKARLSPYTVVSIDPIKAYEEVDEDLLTFFKIVKINKGAMISEVGRIKTDKVSTKFTRSKHTVTFAALDSVL